MWQDRHWEALANGTASPTCCSAAWWSLWAALLLAKSRQRASSVLGATPGIFPRRLASLINWPGLVPGLFSGLGHTLVTRRQQGPLAKRPRRRDHRMERVQAMRPILVLLLTCVLLSRCGAVAAAVPGHGGRGPRRPNRGRCGRGTARCGRRRDRLRSGCYGSLPASRQPHGPNRSHDLCFKCLTGSPGRRPGIVTLTGWGGDAERTGPWWADDRRS